ncbi:Sperm-tail PG-rich repeat-containing protein 2 [Anthophora quadrimaculata]
MQGGVSIDFTDARFKEKIVEGPGPVDYKITTDYLKCGKKRTHPGTWRGPPGKLWLTRPPRSIIPTPTSVPHKNYAGYTMNEYGILVKKPPIEREPTVFYNIPRGEANTTTLMYKGNFWSRMTGREESRFFLTPGPGDYEIEKEKTAAQIQDEKIREEKRMTSRQLRFLDSLYRRKMRENLPAPNRYRVKGSFDKYFKISCKCDPYTLEPPPFGRTAKRFDDKIESDVPGPGTYDPPLRIKCVASIYPAPFGTCAGRFKKTAEDTGPGPSDYDLNVGNLAYELQKRLKYAHFKSTQPQQLYFDEPGFDEEQCDIVGTPEKTEEEKSKVYHAAFKSRAARFKSDETYVPDPGAYEVLTAFKTNRDKCDFLSRRSAPPFGTRSRRSGFCDITSDTPDPTSYHLAGDISRNVKGGVLPRTIIKEETPRAPPPTRYCIHPYFTSSFLKKSHNVTLGKPKIIAALEEEEEPKAGPRCPCTKKKLRWFTTPIDYYQHCHTICI